MILTQPIGFKKFTGLFLLMLAGTYLASLILYEGMFIPNKNLAILQYQLKKLKDPANADTDTIIVGDSSAGNAIDAHYFSEVSGHKTLSLALTGSFGMMGTGNMIENAADVFAHIKNVIIIQTPDIWRREFELPGYLQTRPHFDSVDLGGPLSREELIRQMIAYRINPVQIIWGLKALFPHKDKDAMRVDTHWDYLEQGEKKFSNGGKTLGAQEMALNETIHPDKIAELRFLDAICVKRRLHCIFMHGPLIDTVYQNSRATTEQFNETIAANAADITLVKSFFYYPIAQMGDSPDHTGYDIKKRVTGEYFQAVQKDLQ